MRQTIVVCGYHFLFSASLSFSVWRGINRWELKVARNIENILVVRFTMVLLPQVRVPRYPKSVAPPLALCMALLLLRVRTSTEVNCKHFIKVKKRKTMHFHLQQVKFYRKFTVFRHSQFFHTRIGSRYGAPFSWPPGPSQRSPPPLSEILDTCLRMIDIKHISTGKLKLAL